MKHITPEIKARVFALYWGQKIAKAEVSDGDDRMSKIGGIYSIQHFAERGWFVQVKSLSSITDEDAIEVCGILKYKEDDYFVNNFGLSAHMYLIEHIENDKNGFLGYVVTESFRILQAVDYLRSKGYALPALGYSVDELVAQGVFKIKEVNND